MVQELGDVWMLPLLLTIAGDRGDLYPLENKYGSFICHWRKIKCKLSIFCDKALEIVGI